MSVLAEAAARGISAKLTIYCGQEVRYIAGCFRGVRDALSLGK